MRKSLAILFLASVLNLPSLAWADNEDFGKSAVAQALLKQAAPSESGSARTISAPEAIVPYQIQEEVPADVDALMERVETQNGALVEEFQKLLEKDPLNPDAPKWLGQIAEFHWQMAHYSYLRARRSWISALDSCNESETPCPPEPQADYHLAIEDYRQILAKYPTYEHLDEVLFRLGDALIRNQQSKEGIGYLHRLTQSFPDYQELDAAYLAMGEFYFSQKNTGTAQAAYQTIIDNYPKSRYFQYAQYKLGWTYLNLADEESYQTAIDLFKQVVESIDTRYASAVDSEGQIDENKLNSGEISFRNQALNDLSTTYAELPDGWKQARDYLNSKLPPDKARDKVEQLGGILDAQGKFEEEIELYSDLLAQTPNHAHAIDWRLALIEAYKSANRLDEAEQATRDTIVAVRPDGSWYQTNANDSSAIKKANRFAGFQIYTLAMASIDKAEKSTDPTARDEAWGDAESLLAQWIAHYSKDNSAFDVHYTYAYVLDERSDGALANLKKQYGKRLKSEPALASDVLIKLKEAALAYQTIIDWKSDNVTEERAEQIRVAANRQVFVYANILATSDPEWSIVNSAKTTSFVEEKRGTEIHEAEPLSENELGFVRSAEQFSQRYPKDDETPAFLWRAAEIYRTHYNYNQAAERFDSIVTNFPDHQYAAVAVGSMFELYYKANNYAKIEYWAIWLIEHKNFKHYTAEELENTASFAIDKQAVALADNGQIDEAVSTIMRIETSFPERLEHTTAARFKAAAFEESRSHWAGAIHYLEPIESRSFTPEQSANAAFKIAVNSTKLARYQESAQAFERAASRYFELTAKLADAPKSAPKSTKKSNTKSVQNAEQPEITPSEAQSQAQLEAAQSVFYGAQLYKNLGNHDKASALISNYLDARSQGNYDLYRVGESYKNSPSEDELASATPLLTPATAKLELAALLENPEAACMELSQFYAQPEFAQSSAPLQRQIFFMWTQYALDARLLEKAQNALSHLTPDESEWSRTELARFYYLQGRTSQLEFENVTLEFPIRTLRKRIEQKAKIRQTAEKSFQQAITYKNAQVSTASAYELAQMALHFRDAFKNLPAPKELENDPEGLEEYTLWIEDELIFPAEDAAASLLDVAHQITIQLESYTPQAKKSAQSLAELKPDNYPVSKSSLDF